MCWQVRSTIVWSWYQQLHGRREEQYQESIQNLRIASRLFWKHFFQCTTYIVPTRFARGSLNRMRWIILEMEFLCRIHQLSHRRTWDCHRQQHSSCVECSMNALITSALEQCGPWLWEVPPWRKTITSSRSVFLSKNLRRQGITDRGRIRSQQHLWCWSHIVCDATFFIMIVIPSERALSTFHHLCFTKRMILGKNISWYIVENGWVVSSWKLTSPSSSSSDNERRLCLIFFVVTLQRCSEKHHGVGNYSWTWPCEKFLFWREMLKATSSTIGCAFLSGWEGNENLEEKQWPPELIFIRVRLATSPDYESSAPSLCWHCY